MTIKTYRYILRGNAQGGQTWRVAGVVRCEWGMVLNNIMQRSYQLLTQGKAVYGSPGLGCRGPYDITELNVEKAEDDEADPEAGPQ